MERTRVLSGDTVRERVSFCDAAVREFARKLKQIGREEAVSDGERATRTNGLRASENFARVEHDKRGRSWGGGGGATNSVLSIALGNACV